MSEGRGQHVELLIKWLDGLATGRWVSFCARIVIVDGGIRRLQPVPNRTGDLGCSHKIEQDSLILATDQYIQ